MNKLPIDIAVIDDHEEVLNALRFILNANAYHVTTYNSAKQFTQQYQNEKYHCLIVDILMQEMTGLEFQQWLIAQKIIIPVVFITGHGDIPMAVEAMKRGAIDFLTKPIDNQELFLAIDKAIQHTEIFSERQQKQQVIETRVASLTEREKEVMTCMLDGLPTKSIAKVLNISPNTADVHRGRVLQKLGFKNNGEMINFIFSAEMPLKA